jgi:hypothetical protein
VWSEKRQRYLRQTFLTFRPRSGDGVLVLEDLSVSRVHEGLRASRYGGVVVRRVSLSDCESSGVGLTGSGRANGDDWPSWAEIQGTEVSRCGGRRAHNLDLRADNVLVDGLHSHSSKGGFALNIGARTATVRNSLLETTREPTPGASDPYLSATLLSLDACAGSRVYDNTFVHYRRPGEESADGVDNGTQILQFRNGGYNDNCDRPDYYPRDDRRNQLVVPAKASYWQEQLVLADDPEIVAVDADGNILLDGVMTNQFWRPEFWSAVAAGGWDSPDNPSLFHHFVWNNTFVGRSEWQDEAQCIRNDGTFPHHRGRLDLPTPAGWGERANVWVANNTYDTEDFAATSCGERYHRGDSRRPPAPIHVVGGDDGQPIALPEWWPVAAAAPAPDNGGGSDGGGQAADTSGDDVVEVSGTPIDGGEPSTGGWQQFANTAPINILVSRDEAPPEIFGHGDSTLVMGTWSGAAFDPGRRVFYMHGGGHAGYGGNEVYAFYVDTARWERLTAPSPLAQDPNVTEGTCLRPTDGPKPESIHTYDAFEFTPLTGELVRWGTTLFPTSSVSWCPVGTWAFNPDTRAWRELQSDPAVRAAVGAMTATDPASGRIIVVARTTTWIYDPVSDSYEQLVTHPWSTAGNGAIDPSRRVMLVADKQGLHRIDYVSGTRELMLPAHEIPVSDLPGVGVDYSPTRDRWVLWAGRGNVYTVHPETWEMRAYRHAEGAIPTPYGYGVFGRWRYVEAMDGFVGIGHPEEDVWLYRLPDGDGEPVSTGIVRACSPQGACTEHGTLQAAIDAAAPGYAIRLSPDEFYQCATVSVDGLTIGGPGAHLRDTACGGKAALVVTGDNVTIQDIECSGIMVTDRNGACIRLEAPSLTVRNVYFHDNQQGILGGFAGGTVIVEDSVIERNGFRGRAHGVYISRHVDRLEFRRNSVLSSKGEGHGLKSRAAVSVIEDNVIAGLDGVDSRAIDVPNGGDVVIRNNVLEKGPNSSNRDVIGVALEVKKVQHDLNSTVIEGNTVLCDRARACRLVYSLSPAPIEMTGNTIIGPTVEPADELNQWFADRGAAGWAAYPELSPPR